MHCGLRDMFIIRRAAASRHRQRCAHPRRNNLLNKATPATSRCYGLQAGTIAPLPTTFVFCCNAIIARRHPLVANRSFFHLRRSVPSVCRLRWLGTILVRGWWHLHDNGFYQWIHCIRREQLQPLCTAGWGHAVVGGQSPPSDRPPGRKLPFLLSWGQNQREFFLKTGTNRLHPTYEVGSWP